MSATAQHVHIDAPCAGVTVVELLVALTIGLLGLGVLALVASGMLHGTEADTAAADQQQRARAALAALIDDLTFAGGGAPLVDHGLGWDLPSVVPDRVRSGAWVSSAQPSTITAIARRRSEAHAVLASDVPAGTGRLELVRPPYCASSQCGFAVGDDVLLADRHGRMVFAVVRAVGLPLWLDVSPTVSETVPAGGLVSAVSTVTYATRADPDSGLQQLTQSRGDGPTSTVIDFVTAFTVEWRLNGAPPSVTVAPGGEEIGTSEGPAPPARDVAGAPSWPLGENCVFARDAAGSPVSRLPGLGSDAGTVSLSSLTDGPWCPSPSAAVRWDADLVRVADVRLTLRVAAAAAHLRILPDGPGRSSSRLVPDLVVSTVVRRGRRGLGS